jgi:alpha-galactosidase
VERSAEGALYAEQARRRLADGLPLELDDWPEDATAVVRAVWTGQPATVYASVRNDGLVTNLPDGCCVEVPCLVDAAGVQPTVVGDLPPQLAALNRSFASVCELTVRAVLEERPDHLLHAALLDPVTAATLPPARIDALLDDLLSP